MRVRGLIFGLWTSALVLSNSFPRLYPYLAQLSAMGGSQSYSLTAVTQWYLEGSRHYGKAGFLSASSSFRPDDIAKMTGKVVAITGADQLYMLFEHIVEANSVNL